MSGGLRIKIQVLFIASFEDLLEEPRGPSGHLSLLCLLWSELCCLAFLKVNLVNLSGEHTDDALAQYGI
jgi:hypothetical protein